MSEDEGHSDDGSDAEDDEDHAQLLVSPQTDLLLLDSPDCNHRSSSASCLQLGYTIV